MRICLVGDFSFPDEARKVIANHLSDELSEFCDIKKQNIQDIFKKKFWTEISSFEPDIIHYIPGTSTLSFLATKIMKMNSKKSQTVMFSSLNAYSNFSGGFYYGLSSISKYIIPLIKTDLLLAQSEDTEKFFMKMGCNVKFFISSGVDIEKFCPVSEREKEEYRKKYNISLDKFVVLHVGSVIKWRNVELLADIQNIPNVQVILIGRTNTILEKDVALKLEKTGVMIINKNIPDIKEFYFLSDCYIFPTTNPLGSIDIPLSVLEAMAVNLPVITTSFGGLPRIFKEGDGLIFTKPENFMQKIKELKENNFKIDTRDKVLPYSWKNISKNLKIIYEELRKNK